MDYFDKRKKKKRKRKRKAILAFVFLFFVLIFFYVEFVVNPIVIEATREAVFSLSTSAVSDAVYDVLKDDNITYNDLVDLRFDSDGNVSFLTLQTVALNMIARRFYQVAQVYLDKMGDLGVDVNLGAFSGIPFLVGFGPKINLKLVSIGAMTSEFVSDFSSAGINQTNHTISVKLFASVSMILPAYTKTIDSVTEVLVAESVIVGKIPQVFMGENATLSYSPS